MTTVLTPSEIFLPTTRWPNKVVPLPVSAPDHPYVIGRPRFSVENWTPDDQYAGPAILPGEIIRESRERGGRGNWAQRSIKSTDVPIFRGQARVACRGSGRDFYSDAPTDFWPCTRESMEKVGMNAEIRVNPTMINLGEVEVTDAGKAVAVAAFAGLATFLIARSVLRNR